MPDGQCTRLDEQLTEGEQLRADLADELADHLASVEEELRRAGRAPDAAAAEARARFGDAEAVLRRCWWIHQGDEIMRRFFEGFFRVGVIGALLALFVAGWQAQQAMSARLEDIATQLKTMAQMKTDTPSGSSAVRITGQAYLGESSKPARDVTLTLYTLPDLKPFRFLPLDANGRFDSGDLPTGGYSVMAPIFGAFETRGGFFIQTRPCALYTAGQSVELCLDLSAKAQMTVELARPMPWTIECNRGKLVVQRLYCYVSVPHSLPMSPTGNARWPQSGTGAGHEMIWMAESLKESKSLKLPAGQYSVFAHITAMLVRDKRDARCDCESNPINVPISLEDNRPRKLVIGLADDRAKEICTCGVPFFEGLSLPDMEELKKLLVPDVKIIPAQ